ncbi:DUF6542 domain-containing protein [Actinocrispum wychmicini]|uniref:DUF6542 domain-containing protein n=1 Tax=Actinocrispum wychmicini TaxID=1213861 RepID=A0A4R2JTF7_9PSEU|nr:DUF6542 domain-containing protein [Actinocrispum wychmicini]TCO62417.1 hypothetical protein EV192_102555 [Actinocrispum wychmicini]
MRRSFFRLPGWIAVIAALGLAVGGLALGSLYFPLSIVVGSVVGALFAERSAFFAVAVQPPLITAIVVTGAVFLGRSLLDAATQLASTFPYLVGTMVAVIVILLVRARMSAA